MSSNGNPGKMRILAVRLGAMGDVIHALPEGFGISAPYWDRVFGTMHVRRSR